MRSHSAACAALAVVFGALTSSTLAQDPNAARSLAATCFTCHGTDGRSVGGVPPSLAGQNKALLLQKMKDFKADKIPAGYKIPATIMHQQAKGYTDAELELIATYFSNIKSGPATPAPGAKAPSAMPMQGSY